MPLTPEQRELIQQAKANGAKRMGFSHSTEGAAAWRAAAEAEQQGKADNVAHLVKLKTAAEQAGFFGDVRRAINASQQRVGELASAIGIDVAALSAFRAGEAELPADALDRLITALGLRLMQEIPR